MLDSLRTNIVPHLATGLNRHFVLTRESSIVIVHRWYVLLDQTVRIFAGWGSRRSSSCASKQLMTPVVFKRRLTQGIVDPG